MAMKTRSLKEIIEISASLALFSLCAMPTFVCFIFLENAEGQTAVMILNMVIF